jgi:hypothetical protein
VADVTKVVVGGTLCAYAMLDPARPWLWGAWLHNAEEMIRTSPFDVEFHTSIQVDARGIEPFAPLLRRLYEIGGTHWTFSLDDGRIRVTGENRGRHICTGINLTVEYATSVGATHWLRLEADTEAPPDVIPRLLEVGNGLAAAACSTYFTYDNPDYWARAPQYDFPVVEGPMAAVCLLVEREVFKRLKWRWDPDEQTTDDPSYTQDAKDFFGVPTLTRLDCVASHWPPAIGPVDTRYGDLDMGVQR